MKIVSAWLSHLRTKEDKDDFKKEVIAAKRVLERLVEIIDSKVDESSKSSEKLDNYELPSWSEYQADQLGYRRALREVRSYLEFRQE